MPGFDRTGPSEAGPRTGRRMGLCGPFAGRGIDVSTRGLMGVGCGGAPWGGGRGRCYGGRGMGWGWRTPVGPDPLSPTQEAEALKAQLAAAEEQIAAIQTRLEELAAMG
jgi:hypothetical protein